MANAPAAPHSTAATAITGSDLKIRSWISVINASAAILLLLLGRVLPEPRFTLAFIPLNTVFWLALIGLVLSQKATRAELVLCLRWMLPVAALGLTLAWSPDGIYGAEKFFNLVGIALVSAPLLGAAARQIGAPAALRIWMWCLAALLACALAYKLRYGLLDREVKFFLHTTVTFGRLMALGCVIALVTCTGAARLAYPSSFFIATTWTLSKGPILSVVLSAAAFTLTHLSRMARVLLCAAAIALWMAAPLIADQLRNYEALGRLLQAYDHMTGDSSSGSISDRIELAQSTLDVMREHPWLGTGLGGWKHYAVIAPETQQRIDASEVPDEEYRFPHNMVLEILSEAGWILGLIGLYRFVSFLWYWRSPYFVLPLFCLLNQLVSGNLQDGTFLLVLAYFVARDRTRWAR